VWSYVGEPTVTTAQRNLEKYLQAFSGRHFETTTDSDPDRITANDLVAITMLGVQVPGETAWWILTEGADEISRLLVDIGPASLAIWSDDADLSRESNAWALSDLLTQRQGIGRTIASKLLAAKRPHLFPIYDTVIGAALGIGDANYWELWQDLLRQDAELRSVVASLQRSVAGAEHLSILRVLDITVWMAADRSQ
jgi:hypothetical protein